MAKAIAEQSNSFSIFWLRKNGFIMVDKSYCHGYIKWTYGLSYNESSIEFYIEKESHETSQETAYIRLQYTHTNSLAGEKENMDYKVELVTTPCNYGSVRYWFMCPLYKNGQYCGRRVGVLFSIGKWFGCRYCGEIAYNSQMQGGNYKGFVSIPDIERAEKEVKRWYYRGKPTRKYRKVIRLNEKFENGFIRRLIKLGAFSKAKNNAIV